MSYLKNEYEWKYTKNLKEQNRVKVNIQRSSQSLLAVRTKSKKHHHSIPSEMTDKFDGYSSRETTTTLLLFPMFETIAKFFSSSSLPL